jgi:hypothetical protein
MQAASSRSCSNNPKPQHVLAQALTIMAQPRALACVTIFEAIQIVLSDELKA